MEKLVLFKYKVRGYSVQIYVMDRERVIFMPKYKAVYSI